MTPFTWNAQKRQIHESERGVVARGGVSVCVCVHICVCLLTIEEFPFGENDENVLKWSYCLQNSVQILLLLLLLSCFSCVRLCATP